MEKISIIFLCGSMEQGRDGVGDYTRRLAAEIIRQGHDAAIIAINDQFCNSPVYAKQNDYEISVDVFRLPLGLPQKELWKLTFDWIKDFDPQWLSLQFVPYAFHQKGLPFALAKALSRLGAGRMWHIMFHELAIGLDKNASLKDQIIGKFQLSIVKSLLSSLKPLSVDTQTKLYVQLLNGLGAKANYLPLFSNIPVSSKTKNSRQDDNKKSCAFEEELIFILFGGIHAKTPVESFSKEVVAFANTMNTDFSLITIGRNGKELSQFVLTCENNGLTVNKMGEQPTSVISKMMSRATFGITTTPYLLAEKSGAVAAMRAHHLPIICVAGEWNTRDLDIKNIPDIIYYKEGDLATQLAKNMAVIKNTSNIIQNSLPKVTSLFLKRLKI